MKLVHACPHKHSICQEIVENVETERGTCHDHMSSPHDHRLRLMLRHFEGDKVIGFSHFLQSPSIATQTVEFPCYFDLLCTAVAPKSHSIYYNCSVHSYLNAIEILENSGFFKNDFELDHSSLSLRILPRRISRIALVLDIIEIIEVELTGAIDSLLNFHFIYEFSRFIMGVNQQTRTLFRFLPSVCLGKRLILLLALSLRWAIVLGRVVSFPSLSRSLIEWPLIGGSFFDFSGPSCIPRPRLTHLIVVIHMSRFLHGVSPLILLLPDHPPRSQIIITGRFHPLQPEILEFFLQFIVIFNDWPHIRPPLFQYIPWLSQSMLGSRQMEIPIPLHPFNIFLCRQTQFIRTAVQQSMMECLLIQGHVVTGVWIDVVTLEIVIIDETIRMVRGVCPAIILKYFLIKILPESSIGQIS